MRYISKSEANYLGLKEKYRTQHNIQYLERAKAKYQNYFDHLFDEIDPSICLDVEQREAILVDEDYQMVVAGAGSGKTTTMAGKVKFLIEQLSVEPKDILVISYTNKAVSELQHQICDSFSLPVTIGTFHHVALNLLKRITNKEYQILTNGEEIIYQFIRDKVENNEKLVKQFNLIFSDYFHLSAKYIRLLQGITEFVYSGGKRQNLTNYEIDDWYNLAQRYGLGIIFYVKSDNFKQPYFCKLSNDSIEIYIDYYNFPTTLYDKVKFYSDSYFKRKWHKKNQIYYLSVVKGSDIGDVFMKYCRVEKIKLHKKTNLEIFHSYVNQKSQYEKFVKMIYEFILLKKKSKYNNSIKRTLEDADRYFLEFVDEVEKHYNSVKEKSNLLDFDDIIYYCYKNMRRINNMPSYIIVDEYQDISYDRFLFLNKLCKISHAKLVVVGDDWQSIYRFSGSQLNLFTSFKKHFPFCQILYINHTYRNSQQLIDVCGNFIMENKRQMPKKLLSSKKLDEPIRLFYYKNVKEKSCLLKQLLVSFYKQNKNDRILLLGRFHFDFKFLENDSDFTFKGEKLIYRRYSNMDITCLTVHASKGLGFNQVIIVNNSSGIYGFPSEKETDRYLNLLSEVDDLEQLMEERRLFYVALTRTKNTVSLLVPKQNPSIFVEELNKILMSSSEKSG